ncbi:MAG: queuosine precursor transporter [Bacilli bacterium]|nr:queuosine precursor transporter [Bacilli bacterium]
MKKENYSKTFVILLVLNIVCLLSSNILAAKQVEILGLVFTSSTLLFPISYILNDVFVEVYGYKTSKFTIIISFLSNLLMVLFFTIAIYLPYPDFFKNQDAFKTVLSTTPRILLASVLAYIFGNLFNSKVMAKMKENNKKGILWHRTILSSVVGEFLDTLIFISVAFIGVMSIKDLGIMFLSVYLLKLSVEIIFTPILVKVINKIKKIEKRD